MCLEWFSATVSETISLNKAPYDKGNGRGISHLLFHSALHDRDIIVMYTRNSPPLERGYNKVTGVNLFP